MRQRPFSINVIAGLYLLAGAFCLLFGVDHIFKIEDSRAPLCFALLLWTCAFGIWKIKSWGYTLSILIGMGLVGTTTYDYVLNPEPIKYYTLLCILGCSAIGSYYLQKHILAPYFNPHMKWWDTPKRVRGELPVIVSARTGSHDGRVLNLSRSGCFVQTPTTSLDVGDLIFLKIAVSGVYIFVMTKIVRQVKDSVHNGSKGYGVMFLDVGREEKKLLGRVMDYMSETWSSASSPSKAVASIPIGLKGSHDVAAESPDKRAHAV